MVTPVMETPDGSIATDALDEVKEHLRWADLLILGPGLSRNPATQELVRSLVSKATLPILLDADGLNAIAGQDVLLKRRKSPHLILTPHAGEFARLTGRTAARIESDRIGLARAFAQETALTLVLKGAPTVTAGSDGTVCINSTGNAGMATAGSGDVLTGIIGGLWAQGMDPLEAAYAGVYIHGSCGDHAKEKFGEKSLMAMDLYDAIPFILKKLARTGG